MNSKDNLLVRKIIISILVIILIASMSLVVEAEPTVTIDPQENQYFELKATTINKVNDHEKQVIMELWGYNLDFKRFRCKISI